MNGDNTVGAGGTGLRLGLGGLGGLDLNINGADRVASMFGMPVPGGGEDAEADREVRVTVKLERFETIANSAERIRGQVSELVLRRAPLSPSAR